MPQGLLGMQLRPLPFNQWFPISRENAGWRKEGEGHRVNASLHPPPFFLMRCLTLFLLLSILTALDMPAADPAPPRVLPNGMEEINVPIAPGPCEPTWKSLGEHFTARRGGARRRSACGCTGGRSPSARTATGMPSGFTCRKYAWGKIHAESISITSSGRASERVRLQGHAAALEGGEVGSGQADGALQAGRGAVCASARGCTTTTSILWDSKYQPWNAVKIGPHRDIVGGWKKAARQAGHPLRHRLSRRLFALVVPAGVSRRSRRAEEGRARTTARRITTARKPGGRRWGWT